MERFSRTALIFGEDALKKLARCRVAVFGLGGVGGYAAEALARSGVGALDLVDSDCVSLSNLNRQILATERTIGRKKTEVAAERIAEIDPACTVRTYPVFFLPENRAEFPFAEYDYIIDAVDTVTAKIALAEAARDENVPIISAMGTGNKTDPTMLEVADIFETSVCPLARVMRRELKKRGIAGLKTVYSKEPPRRVQGGERKENGREVPGSTAFVPAAAGLILAAETVKDLIARDL